MRLGRTLAVLLAVLALLAPAAGAQQAPSLGAPTTTESAPVVTTDGGDNGGLSTWQELLIFGAGLALLAGIAFAILGDARERTRGRRATRPEPAAAGVAPPRQSPQAKQRSRARAKAARAQRRRNR
jgi:hypothetical protein